MPSYLYSNDIETIEFAHSMNGPTDEQKEELVTLLGENYKRVYTAPHVMGLVHGVSHNISGSNHSSAYAEAKKASKIAKQGKMTGSSLS